MSSLHHLDIHHERPRLRSLSSKVYLPALWLVPVLAACLILWSILQAEHLPPIPIYHVPTRGDPINCGSSPSEARSHGCCFDILSFAWQAPECYDADLLDEFMRYDNWTFYTKPTLGTTAATHHHNNNNHNHTTPPEDDRDSSNNNDNANTDNDNTLRAAPPETVSLATALQGQRTLYVDQRFHVVHCTFAWRQLHRAYALRGYVDSHIDSYAHTLHCQKVLLLPPPPPPPRGLDGGVGEGAEGVGGVTVVAELKYPGCRKVW